MGQRGEETGGTATPLVDATMKFFEEFVFKERELPLARQLPQQAAKGMAKEEKKGNKVVDSFEATYMYDAMKEKRQLRNVMVRSHAT
jgi:hypothetical protein